MHACVSCMLRDHDYKWGFILSLKKRVCHIKSWKHFKEHPTSVK